MSKIVNGVDAAVGRYPYMAALLTSPNATYSNYDYYGGYYDYSQNVKNRNLQYYTDNRVNQRLRCGGTLITPNVVLAAAHCVIQLEGPGEIDVAFGCEDITDESDCTIVPSEFVARNPEFLEDFSRAGDDLALIFLAEEVDFPVVKLAGPGIVPTNGDQVRNIGWGETLRNDPAPAEKLQEVDVHIVENDVCIPQIQEAFEITDPSYYPYVGGNIVSNGNLDTIICTIGDAKSSCFGDSGGPLLYACDSGEQPDIQIGVVSFGFTCAGDSQPVAFEQVNSQAGITFITEQLALRGQSIELVNTLDNFCPSIPPVIKPAPTPFPTFNADDWTCDSFRFGDLVKCDCNCGIPDVDCEFFNTPEVTNGCDDIQICVNDECVEFELTEQPSAKPTNSHIVSPTTTPSVNPTNSPTGTPSTKPSVKPTSSPTSTPTTRPSANPTNSPTVSPTTTPSVNPTKSATATPLRTLPTLQMIPLKSRTL